MLKQMMIHNISEAEAELAKYIPLTKEITGKNITLERMRPLMEHLGNPQEKLRIIHVAGTSGKTSTAYFIAKMLNLAGQKVGLTISPHISTVTERVQINVKPLPDADFCQELAIFLRKIEHSPLQPTYFELLVAFAYWYFAKAKVDYAVIETGLGGLHDATNIASKPDKVCVITDIGIDHTHVLGKTVDEIAGQKAGIIHNGNHVFMHLQAPAIMNVFQSAATERNARINALSDNVTLALTKLPPYQQRNWLLAKSAFDFVAKRDSLKQLDFDSCRQSQAVVVPGRMELIAEANKQFVLDGAHNQQKMQAFTESFKVTYPSQKTVVVLSLKQDKAYQDVLPLLKPICSQLIVTEFSRAQDLPAKPIKAHDLAQAAKNLGFQQVLVEPMHEKALQLAMSQATEVIIITGSLYLVGEAKNFLEKN